jgi:hypothetical protein
MLQNVIILVLTALASSLLWWRSRFKNMSAVSVTDKTVGVGLPRLRRGAVGWQTKLPIQSYLAQSWRRKRLKKVFGWKNVHKHNGALVGKEQDKAGRWRLTERQWLHG